MSTADRARLSQLRREAFALLRECKRLLTKLAHPSAMVAGSFYQMHKKCGRPTCRCAEGELHGPFPVIALRHEGRRSTRSVSRDGVVEVRRRADAYRTFQRRRRRLREAMRRIVEIVTELREAHLEDFP